MHCPTCGGIDNNTQSYCKACGTNLKLVREALSPNKEATVAAEQDFSLTIGEKDLPYRRLANRSQVLKQANALQIIRFSLSTICILVPLLVLGGMAASGILLNQVGGNLIMWIGILTFGLGIAFDWEIGRYMVGEGEVVNNSQKTREFWEKEIGTQINQEYLIAPPSVVEATTKNLEKHLVQNKNKRNRV